MELWYKSSWISSKIPCFPDCVPSALIHFQRSSNSWRGIFWPFGTVCNQFYDFQKNSAECSVFSILCQFMWSVALIILKLSQNNSQTLWTSSWEFEIGCKHFEQVPRHSVKNSVFSRFCHISLIILQRPVTHRPFGTV